MFRVLLQWCSIHKLHSSTSSHFFEVLPQGPGTQTQWSCSLNRPHLPKQTSRSAIRGPCASSQNTCGSWTAICRHPRTHKLTGNRKKLNQSSVDQHSSMLCFYEITRTSNFWVKGISIEAVFVNQLSGNAGISDLRIVWLRETTVSWSTFLIHFAPHSNVLEKTLFLNILWIPPFRKQKKKKK